MMTTLYLSEHVFRDCAGRYPIMIMIVDSTYALAYGNVHVKRFQLMLGEVYRLGCKMETADLLFPSWMF